MSEIDKLRARITALMCNAFEAGKAFEDLNLRTEAIAIGEPRSLEWLDAYAAEHAELAKMGEAERDWPMWLAHAEAVAAPLEALEDQWADWRSRAKSACAAEQRAREKWADLDGKLIAATNALVHAKADAIASCARLIERACKGGGEVADACMSLRQEMIEGNLPDGENALALLLSESNARAKAAATIADDLGAAAARYRTALEHIAAGNMSPAIGFARRILDGASTLDAHRAEVEEMNRDV